MADHPDLDWSNQTAASAILVIALHLGANAGARSCRTPLASDPAGAVRALASTLALPAEQGLTAESRAAAGKRLAGMQTGNASSYALSPDSLISALAGVGTGELRRIMRSP